MRQIVLTGAVWLAMASPAAFAQTAAPNGAVPNGNAGSAEPSDHGRTGDIRQQLLTNLRDAGFTDVRVMPDSFLVQAKDRSGNPVTMFINPTSMAVITQESEHSVTTATGNASATRSDGGGAYTSISAQQELNSKVVGLDVYNHDNQDIGKIKDVAFDRNGVKAYIVAVGGFLGVGDRYVAVKPAAIHLTYNSNDKAWHAAMNVDADALKAAPEYKYSSND